MKQMPLGGTGVPCPIYPPTPNGCQPDLLVSHHHHHQQQQPVSANIVSNTAMSNTTGMTVRSVRHDVVCHLDASAASIASPTSPALLHPSIPIPQQRSPWSLQSPLHPTPELPHFAMPMVPPYAFVSVRHR